MKDDSYIFEQYLDGLLDPAAKLQFEEKLRTNQEFADRFDLYRRMDEMLHRLHGHVFGVQKLNENSKAPDISELGDLEEDINKFYKNKAQSEESDRLKQQLKNVYREYHQLHQRKIGRSAVLGMAAGLALLALLSIVMPHSLYSGKSSSALYLKYYCSYPAAFNKRGVSTDDASLRWQNAISLYQQKQFNAALIAFESLSDLQKRNDILDLYIGICRIETGDFVKARELFFNLSERKNSIVKDQALWYLGMIYLHMDDRLQAIQTLSKMNGNGSELSLRATKVLKDLN